jgi:6-phosphogluconolactonase
MAVDTLLSHVPIPRSMVHRMKGEMADTAAAAAAYEAELRGVLGTLAPPVFDVALLGMGADGHTASLFPGTAALDVADRWVAANFVPKLDAWRITLTLPALAAARRVLFLVAGADKAAVASAAFGAGPLGATYPAARVAAPAGKVEVLLDRAAAERF